jgi:glucose-6-phosphate isomerase
MKVRAKRVLALVLSLGLIFQQLSFAQVASELNIAGYLSGVGSKIMQDKFRPLQLRYFSYDPLNDNFRLLLDKGDLKALDDAKTKEQAKVLLNYFLIGVALPDEAFWVNLRPDSENQIIDRYLERTDVGKIMLEADLQLKKDTALFTSPQTPEGREYWDKLYKKAGELYGYDTVTIPTLTRPWIVPGEIIIRESKESAYVYKAGLKVMLEQDYLNKSQIQNSKSQINPKSQISATIRGEISPNYKQFGGQNYQQYEFKDLRLKQLNEYSSQLIREIIIPKLTKEVNSSKRYAALRQVYYSLILARWFKLRFNGKKGTYAALVNSRNLNNLASTQAWSKTTYFKQYQKSFADGEYNIKEPVYTPAGQTIRSYFSGGIQMNTMAQNGFAPNTQAPGSLFMQPDKLSIEGNAKSGDIGEITPPRAGSTYGHMQEAILEAHGRLSQGKITLPEAAQIIVKALKTMEEEEYIVNLGTAIDILKQANVSQFVSILRILESYAEKKDHSGLREEIKKTSALEVLLELERNSGLPFATAPSKLPADTSPTTFWSNLLRALHFAQPVYRRVEREAQGEERHRGRPAFDSANEGVDTDIKELSVYDVSEPEFYSIRKGEDVRGFIRNPKADLPTEAYFMHRGVFASREDIQKAFYDNKIRFDITVIPPAVWGVDFAKTVGHYHQPLEMPEIYQVISGEVLWLMQKCDEKGNVIEFITVRAKAGDIAIMLPGYGHVSVNLSETEPLVMANWLTWHQSSFYGSFKEKRGAAYYVIKNNQGQTELIPNAEYLKTQKELPAPRQMLPEDEIPAFGLTRGKPIYDLLKLKDEEFSQKVRFLNHPLEFSELLTPEKTLTDTGDTGSGGGITFNHGSSAANRLVLYSFSTEGIPDFEAIESEIYNFQEMPAGTFEVDSALKQAMENPQTKSIAREYDLRGDISIFTPDVTRAFISAQIVMAYQMDEGNNRRILIAADQEDYNQEGVEIAMDEFRRAGFEVFYINRPSTAPLAYIAALYLNCDNIAFFSASHNPYGDKGLKIGIKKGTTFGPFGTKTVNEIAKRGLKVKKADREGMVTTLAFNALLLQEALDYYRAIHRDFFGIELDSSRFHIVINPIGGTTGFDKDGNSSMKAVLDRMGFSSEAYEFVDGEMHSSREIPDGKQPNPELQWVKEMMQAHLRQIAQANPDKIIIGMAFDRDSDRQTLLDAEVQSSADKLGVLAIRQMAANYRNKHPQDKRKLVAYVDMKCSLLVFNDPELKRLNVEVRPTKTGHSYLKWHLRQAGQNTQEITLAAFEQSGHCFYRINPAIPNSEVVEDPLAFIFSVLQYLQENDLTLARALETTAAYEVGPSTKFYFDPSKFDSATTGKTTLSERKYSFMEDTGLHLRGMVGKLVVNGKYRLHGVEQISGTNFRLFFSDPEETTLMGSCTYRPSSNEEVLTINTDVDKTIPGLDVKQFIKDVQNFITFDLSAARAIELTTLYPTATNKKIGLLNQEAIPGQEMLDYALANGWSKVGDITQGTQLIRHQQTGNEVSIILNEGASSSTITEKKEDANIGDDLSGPIASTPIGTSASLAAQSASNNLNGLGGIDFRTLPMTIQPIGSFKGLDFKVPRLNPLELDKINIGAEIQQIKNMLQAGIIPSGTRVKELVAACVQKGKISAHSYDLLLCLASIFKLEEENAIESSPELRETLVIVEAY